MANSIGDWIVSLFGGDSGTDRITDMLNTQDDEAYAQLENEYNAYLDYVNQYNNWANSNAAASNAAAAANRAGQQAEQQAKLQQAQKAKQRQKQAYEEVASIYKPYVSMAQDTANTMQNTYNMGTTLANNLLGVLGTNNNMQKLNNPYSTSNIKITLPNSIKGGS